MNANNENSPQWETRLANPNSESSSSSIIGREIKAFSKTYGILAGLSFAVGMWGWDAYQLSQAHAFFPWLKLALGILLCALVGGTTGWLVSRKESGGFSFLFWFGASVLFSWITVSLPLQVMPALSKFIEPNLNGLLNYDLGDGSITRFWIALIWIMLFLPMAGILQTTLVESAVFANSAFGKAAPFLICMIWTGISGMWLDDLINAPFRGAIISVETPIQFIIDNQGKIIDPALSRKFHAGALGGVQKEITQSRKLIISDYDETFGRINVLVQFEGAWVTCITVNNQASYCKLAEASP